MDKHLNCLLVWIHHQKTGNLRFHLARLSVMQSMTGPLTRPEQGKLTVSEPIWALNLPVLSVSLHILASCFFTHWWIKWCEKNWLPVLDGCMHIWKLLQSQAWQIQVNCFFFFAQMCHYETSSIFLIQVTKRTSKPLPPKKRRHHFVYLGKHTLDQLQLKRSLYSTRISFRS